MYVQITNAAVSSTCYMPMIDPCNH